MPAKHLRPRVIDEGDWLGTEGSRGQRGVGTKVLFNVYLNKKTHYGRYSNTDIVS